MLTPLRCLRVVARACMLQGATDAWGEGGAVDGGAVVGAPRVRVPQLPGESLASFVSVWWEGQGPHVLDAICFILLARRSRVFCCFSYVEILDEQLAQHQTC